MNYDPDNVFARVLRGEIPCNKVHEDEFALAFHDLHPQAPVHVLVIPKGPWVSLEDFSQAAPLEMQAGFLRAVATTARELGLVAGGYRILANHGNNAGQEVPHFHVHIFGGRPMGRMVQPG